MNNTLDSFASVLYCLVTYEKGRLVTSKSTFISEKKRLSESVEMMSMLLCGIECRECSTEKINDFISKNQGKIFPDNCYLCSTNMSMNITKKQRGIISLMRYILSEIKAILSKNRIKKNELQEISYLLRAFHNLPRAFFSCSSNLYLSYNDALKNANDWLLFIPRAVCVVEDIKKQVSFPSYEI